MLKISYKQGKLILEKHKPPEFELDLTASRIDIEAFFAKLASEVKNGQRKWSFDGDYNFYTIIGGKRFKVGHENNGATFKIEDGITLSYSILKDMGIEIKGINNLFNVLWRQQKNLEKEKKQREIMKIAAEFTRINLDG